MSMCIRSENGQPQCDMVDHPDDPSRSFCRACKDCFRKEMPVSPVSSPPTTQKDSGLPPFPLVVMFGVVFALLTGGGITPRGQISPPPELVPSEPTLMEPLNTGLPSQTTTLETLG